MSENKFFDIIIIGGSYSGLSAAMALGRSLRSVLVIDSGLPCNRQTPHSHNFLTQDGKTPKEISDLALEQVLKYDTVQFLQDTATKGSKTVFGFQVQTQSGKSFEAKKLIFATGIKDILPDIKGFKECWGISIIHCPYCHGYEVRNEKTAILTNGDIAFEMGKLISNWTHDLQIFTNGKSTLNEEQYAKLKKHNISVVEKEIESFEQINGKIQTVIFKDNFRTNMTAIYARLPFVQHCDIPVALGCERTEQGYLKIDNWQKTTIEGVFACGDNSSFFRSVSNVVNTGTFVGAVVNKELIEEGF